MAWVLLKSSLALWLVTIWLQSLFAYCVPAQQCLFEPLILTANTLIKDLAANRSVSYNNIANITRGTFNGLPKLEWLWALFRTWFILLALQWHVCLHNSLCFWQRVRIQLPDISPRWLFPRCSKLRGSVSSFLTHAILLPGQVSLFFGNISVISWAYRLVSNLSMDQFRRYLYENSIAGIQPGAFRGLPEMTYL